jgi:hypothetical protein
VKLNDAIRRAETVVKDLKGHDAAAIHALIDVGKRVRRFQKPIRHLADLFAPRAPELNQVPLFEDESQS